MTNHSYSGKGILAVSTDCVAAKTQQQTLLSFESNQKLLMMYFDCTEILKLLHGSLLT